MIIIIEETYQESNDLLLVTCRHPRTLWTRPMRNHQSQWFLPLTHMAGRESPVLAAGRSEESWQSYLEVTDPQYQ